jgi:hypothetical protein
MSNNKTLLLVLFLGASLFASAQKQNYKTAIGLKFSPTSLTFKHFLEKNNALEIQLQNWIYGFRVTGLYEVHKPIKELTGLKWYYGGGAHIAFYNEQWKWQKEYDGQHTSSIGIDGVLGLDYKFESLPINLSLDWQPSFDLIGYTRFWGNMGGLAVRYTIK